MTCTCCVGRRRRRHCCFPSTCGLTSALLSPQGHLQVTEWVKRRGWGTWSHDCQSLNPNISYLIRPCQRNLEINWELGVEAFFFFFPSVECRFWSPDEKQILHLCSSISPPDMKSNDCSSLLFSFPWVSKAPLNIPLRRRHWRAELLLIWWTLGELWPFPLTGPAVCELCTLCSCRENLEEKHFQTGWSVSWGGRRVGHYSSVPPKLCPYLNRHCFLLNANQTHKYPKELEEMPHPTRCAPCPCFMGSAVICQGLIQSQQDIVLAFNWFFYIFQLQLSLRFEVHHFLSLSAAEKGSFVALFQKRHHCVTLPVCSNRLCFRFFAICWSCGPCGKRFTCHWFFRLEDKMW